jgi:TRAP-type mannitol/chloroaromatic compound transport system permease large subunit
MIGLVMFGTTLLLLMVGFPVAFTFAGVAVIFGVLTQGVDLFGFMPYRIMSVMPPGSPLFSPISKAK